MSSINSDFNPSCYNSPCFLSMLTTSNKTKLTCITHSSKIICLPTPNLFSPQIHHTPSTHNSPRHWSPPQSTLHISTIWSEIQGCDMETSSAQTAVLTLLWAGVLEETLMYTFNVLSRSVCCRLYMCMCWTGSENKSPPGIIDLTSKRTDPTSRVAFVHSSNALALF